MVVGSEYQARGGQLVALITIIDASEHREILDRMEHRIANVGAQCLRAGLGIARSVCVRQQL